MKRLFSFPLVGAWSFLRRCLFSRRSKAVIRRVSFICLLGLVVSTASLVVIFNVMGGLGQSIRDKFLAHTPHIVITQKRHGPILSRLKIQNILKQKGLLEGVSGLHFFETVDLIIRSQNGHFTGAEARGYHSKHLQTWLPPKQAAFEKEFFKEKTIIISPELSEQLNITLGSSVQLIPSENLLLPPGTAVSFEKAFIKAQAPQSALNANIIFYDRALFPSFRQKSSYASGFELRLKNPNRFALYQNALKSLNGAVAAWPEQNSSIFFALQIERAVMSLFLSLAGVITLMAVASLLALLIVQKKKEIGALAAVGFSLHQIRRLFVSTGLLLSAVGILGGGILGAGVCLALAYVPARLFIPFFHEDTFPVQFYPGFLALFMASALLFAGLTCWLAVQSQLKQTPAELLKSLNG